MVSERAQDCSRAVLVRVGRDLLSCIFSRSDLRGWFQRNMPLPARIGRDRAYQLVNECVPVCLLFVALQVNHVLRFLCALPLGCSQKHCRMDSALLRGASSCDNWNGIFDGHVLRGEDAFS